MRAPFDPDEDDIGNSSLPCMKIQLTTFTTPGVAIAVGLAHPLADARSLLGIH